MEELIPDPEWHDLECPPPVEEYHWYNIPRFGKKMQADRGRWAPDVDMPIVSAMVRAVTGLVVPHIMDFQQYRRHTTEFFKRLCGHRRLMHTQWNRAMQAFTTRQRTLAEKILDMEQRIKVLEVQLAAARMGAHPPQCPVSCGQPRREHSLPERSLGAAPVGSDRRVPSVPERFLEAQLDAGSYRRVPSVPERILEAQLDAIGRRSDSPGPDALRALEQFRETHGPPFPATAVICPGVPSPPLQPTTQVSRRHHAQPRALDALTVASIPPQPDTQVSRGRTP